MSTGALGPQRSEEMIGIKESTQPGQAFKVPGAQRMWTSTDATECEGTSFGCYIPTSLKTESASHLQDKNGFISSSIQGESKGVTLGQIVAPLNVYFKFPPPWEVTR